MLCYSKKSEPTFEELKKLQNEIDKESKNKDIIVTEWKIENRVEGNKEIRELNKVKINITKKLEEQERIIKEEICKEIENKKILMDFITEKEQETKNNKESK